MSVHVRAATPDDVAAIRDLLPRLATFELPDRRSPEHLWQGDEETLLAWARGEKECTVLVAEDGNQSVVGVAMTTLRPEMLSGAPSAHLEVLAVAERVERRGVGDALVDASEREAVRRKAETMTLHVFANNQRARRLYEKRGFDGELLRMIKDLA